MADQLSDAQKIRNGKRDSSGRYTAHTCECCGKPAPMEYLSDDRCNSTGFGVVLRKSCAKRLAKLSDEEYAKLAQERRAK